VLRLSSGRPTARPPPRSHVDAKRESVSATRLKTKLKRKVSFARPGASAAARHPIAQGRGASAAAVDVASEGAVRVRLHRPAPGEPLGLGLVSLGGTGSIAIACLAHGSAAAASGLLRPLDAVGCVPVERAELAEGGEARGREREGEKSQSKTVSCRCAITI